MEKIKAWLAAHKVSAHTVTVVWLFLSGLFASSSAFRDYVLALYGKFPASVHEFVAAVIIPAIVYYRSQKSTK